MMWCGAKGSGNDKVEVVSCTNVGSSSASVDHDNSGVTSLSSFNSGYESAESRFSKPLGAGCQIEA